MIQVQNLAKSFDNRVAVRSLSFTAPDGAITGLLGAGAGSVYRHRSRFRLQHSADHT
jgi:ABC-type Na+ transport system ATPase subunit NatA